MLETTAWRVIAPDAVDAAFHGHWWIDDVVAGADIVTTLEPGSADDCRCQKADLKLGDSIQTFDLEEELYEPHHEATWKAAIAAGASAVVVRNVIGTEHGEPCTFFLLSHPNQAHFRGLPQYFDELEA